MKIKHYYSKVVLFFQEKDSKKRLLKLKQILSKRDAYVFLVFLLISTGFWFLNALRDDYVTDFTYPVRFVNVPPNEIVVEGKNQKVDLKIKASGFTILRQRLSSSFIPVVYDISQMNRLDRMIRTWLMFCPGASWEGYAISYWLGWSWWTLIRIRCF
ncbi:hypothetical protein [Geofilum rubicundum]|nr:hypothetical protein [Geofilum rubicundum]